MKSSKFMRLLCSNCKDNIKVYLCLCCGKLRLEYGFVSLLFNKTAFTKFANVVRDALRKTVEETDGKICLRYGSTLLQVSFSELYNLNLYLQMACEILSNEECRQEIRQLGEFTLN